jgi:hypothetical protein
MTKYEIRMNDEIRMTSDFFGHSSFGFHSLFGFRRSPFSFVVVGRVDVLQRRRRGAFDLANAVGVMAGEGIQSGVAEW